MEEGGEEDEMLPAHGLMGLVDEQVGKRVWESAPLDVSPPGHHQRLFLVLFV
jgi:hypothetical protein